MELTELQLDRRSEFRDFVDSHIVPYANSWDEQERLPSDVIGALAARRYLGAVVPKDWGGLGLDMIEFGALNEELGRGCSSVRSLLTVHSMVSSALLRWGSEAQRKLWLARLARSEAIAAFALSEATAGSDSASIEMEAIASGDGFFLSGHKKWISFAQIADLYLLFAKSTRGPCAFLVERGTQGLNVCSIRGLLGAKASMIAELHLDQCWVSKENLVGSPGVGLSHVASWALDCGRYSVAWGCVGIAEACLQSCLQYTSNRKQFGRSLKDNQLVQRIISQMVASTKAARLLCYHAGRLRDSGDPSSMVETLVAKYAASKAAARASRDAVQLHGANGCVSGSSVERFFRDAKVMEIIEGSSEIQEIAIAEHAYQESSAVLARSPYCKGGMQ